MTVDRAVHDIWALRRFEDENFVTERVNKILDQVPVEDIPEIICRLQEKNEQDPIPAINWIIDLLNVLFRAQKV